MVYYGHDLDSTKSKGVEELKEKILGGIGLVGLIGAGLVFAPVITIAVVTIPITVGVGAAVLNSNTPAQKSQQELSRPAVVRTEERAIAENAQKNAQDVATKIGVHTADTSMAYEQYLTDFN